jgi:putative sporulation protein YtxC
MKFEFQISTASDNNSILQECERRFQWIKEKGYSLDLNLISNKVNNRDMVKIVLYGRKSPGLFRDADIIHIFKHQMSEILAEHILSEWEEKLIRKEINRNCKPLSVDEKEGVFSRAREFIRNCHNSESLNLLMNYGRKNRIAHRIFDHIENCQHLAIEGFINFCMQDYLTELRFAVELAREELKNEKEYNEFIKLLRHFVETQSPKVYEVNLTMGHSGVFSLWDENGTNIEKNYINYYLSDMIYDDINLDDLLISILITIAPRRIVLHQTNGLSFSEPVKIIKKVFKDRIIICPGCERCYDYASNTDHKRHT